MNDNKKAMAIRNFDKSYEQVTENDIINSGAFSIIKKSFPEAVIRKDWRGVVSVDTRSVGNPYWFEQQDGFCNELDALTRNWFIHTSGQESSIVCICFGINER